MVADLARSPEAPSDNINRVHSAGTCHSGLLEIATERQRCQLFSESDSLPFLRLRQKTNQDDSSSLQHIERSATPDLLRMALGSAADHTCFYEK